jgi:hypothetical protein
MTTYTETELFLASQIGALRYGCEQALALLRDGDAEAKDADRVEKLLETVLRG